MAGARLEVTAGTRHFADYSANRIKMLGMHLDACTARQPNRYPGCGRDHRRRCRNYCDLPEDTTPRRHTPNGQAAVTMLESVGIAMLITYPLPHGEYFSSD